MRPYATWLDLPCWACWPPLEPSNPPDTLTQADAQALSQAAQGDLQLTSAMLGDASSAALSAQGLVDSL